MRAHGHAPDDSGIGQSGAVMQAFVENKSFLNINGHVCAVCLSIIVSLDEPDIVQCSGACRRIMHAECAMEAFLMERKPLT